MRIRCECRYCGHQFTEYVYALDSETIIKCPKCGDRNVRQIKEENTDPYGYNKPVDSK